MSTVQMGSQGFEQLKRWYANATREVEWCALSSQTFRELQELVSATSILQEPGTNWSNQWLAANYGIVTALLARSQLDQDKRAVSLYRILEEMAAAPSVFSRKRFVRSFRRARSGTVQEANDAFDAFAGRGRGHLDPELVRRDLRRLRTELAVLKKWVDKRAAHLERGFGRRKLKLRTLTRAIEALEKLAKKYSPLFHGRPADPWFGVHRSSDWKRFFAGS
jgi:hypothetical protein